MKRICLMVACILCFPSAILAENRTVTLKEAIHLALLNNNLVKAAEFQRTAEHHKRI